MFKLKYLSLHSFTQFQTYFIDEINIIFNFMCFWPKRVSHQPVSLILDCTLKFLINCLRLSPFKLKYLSFNSFSQFQTFFIVEINIFRIMCFWPKRVFLEPASVILDSTSQFLINCSDFKFSGTNVIDLTFSVTSTCVYCSIDTLYSTTSDNAKIVLLSTHLV